MTTEDSAAELPEQLTQIREDFLALAVRERLQLLLEFSNELPELPERYLDHPDLLERVEECQSPVFIFVEVDDASIVHLYATAPKEAPTTRGFASILAQGLAGLTAEQVLAVPDDYPNTIGLTEAVSPLRIRGMTALLGRTKRQVREKLVVKEPRLRRPTARQMSVTGWSVVRSSAAARSRLSRYCVMSPPCSGDTRMVPGLAKRSPESRVRVVSSRKARCPGSWPGVCSARSRQGGSPASAAATRMQPSPPLAVPAVSRPPHPPRLCLSPSSGDPTVCDLIRLSGASLKRPV